MHLCKLTDFVYEMRRESQLSERRGLNVVWMKRVLIL